MEIKKSPKADLESKKSTWLLVGYVIVLAFMFVAFEWTKRDIKIDTSQAITDVFFEEEIIPITEQPEQVTPPPPEAPSIAETLTIVEDDADVEETAIVSSEELNQAVEIKYVPVAVEEEEPEEQTIFEVVEQMPEFPNGGMAGLMQYLSKNIKYPTIAQENGTQGRVTVQFVVNKDGSIVDAKVLRGVDPYLDKEAVREIGYIYIDSGAMYRAVTLYSIENGIFQGDRIDAEKLKSLIKDIHISFRLNPETGRPDTYLNGVNVENKIRTMEVSSRVSPIATLDFVREAMVAQQQEMGKAKGIVMDGRDIGTTVFPDAELKIFVTATPEIRAQRRYDELKAKGEEASFDEILENVKQRDYIDQNRDVSPLRKASDALLLDNSHLSISQQKEWLAEQFERVIKEKN